MSSEHTSTTHSTPTEVHTVFKRIHMSFPVYELEEKRPDQAFLRVDREGARALLTHLNEVSGYRHLAFFTAIDYIEEGTFRLVYMLHNYGLRHDLGVMVDIDRQGEGCRMESIHHLWPAAETYQRELREMFGIDFPGSPRLEEDFALEGWDGTPPMRREFDTRAYSEETYYARPGRHTHDTRAHMKEKLYPSEAETW